MRSAVRSVVPEPARCSAPRSDLAAPVRWRLRREPSGSPRRSPRRACRHSQPSKPQSRISGHWVPAWGSLRFPAVGERVRIVAIPSNACNATAPPGTSDSEAGPIRMSGVRYELLALGVDHQVHRFERDDSHHTFIAQNDRLTQKRAISKVDFDTTQTGD